MKKKLTKEEKEWRAKYRKDLRRRILDSRVYVFRFPKEIKTYLKYVRDYVRWIERCEYGYGSSESNKRYAAKLAGNLFVVSANLSTMIDSFAEINSTTNKQTTNENKGE